MEYVAHHRFRELAMCGKILNLPFGTRLKVKNEILISPTGYAVCYTTSENAKKYFAIDDDGRGLERGELTYAIAYAPRKTAEDTRFTADETTELKQLWGKYLRPDLDVVIFNDAFFTAPVEDLEGIANMLNINI